MKRNATPIVELLFSRFTSSIGKIKESQLIPLYPYRNRVVVVSFLYGDDYQLEIGSPSILRIMAEYWFIPIWFVLTTISLHLIRSKIGIGNNELSSTIMDMIIIFFGGGTIKFRHKIERYFLGMLLIGTFFIQAIWVSDFLSKVSTLRGINRVNTFEKIANLKSPIYFGLSLAGEKELIIESLK